MIFFELNPSDISNLTDADLREMVARLCEAELITQKVNPYCVRWGGAQEAADGGLDVRIVDANPLSKQGFVPRANTGFQVKRESMGRARCKDEMLDKGAPKPVIKELATQKGAYIIVSGKDDCTGKMLSNRLQGMKSAVENLPDGGHIFLDFYGRDRLGAWLRQFPGVALWVRSRLGKPLSGWQPFGRWTSTPIDKDDDLLLDEHPCVIDINSRHKKPVSISDGIRLVRERLRKPGSVVRITGLSGVGKTRFAQALFENSACDDPLPKTNAIYADLGNELNPTASELVSYLIANDFISYLVLDNCPPDIHRRLQRQVSSQKTKISLLTIEYDISDDRPEETETIHIDPSSEKVISQLLKKRFPSLGFVNSGKIAEFSGGNARVAIALASRVATDETLANFSDADLFFRLFSQRKKETSVSLMEDAEVLSLFYSINSASTDCNDELGVLGTIGNLTRDRLVRSLAELFRRQLLQKRGDWRAVLPHALANRLARRALENIAPEKINAELLKPENRRLFKSCAHRLGFLHDCEPARHLAQTWMNFGGPLHNITQCDAELLTSLTYIAPVFPDVVLGAIERASEDSNFCSQDNTNHPLIIRLLRKIAYDDQHFNRAAGLILRFAEIEKKGTNTITTQLAGLFSLHLSGTQATPDRRLSFLNSVLNSNSSRRLEIAQAIFQAAFEVSHWNSFETFDFGARSRDSGWKPTVNKDSLDWYNGYIGLLLQPLEANNIALQNWAKEILATNFNKLWCHAGCFDLLEAIIHKYGDSGKWPHMWMAIKKTIHYSGKNHDPQLLKKIKAMENFSAPTDPYSEVAAYALINLWEHAEIMDANPTEESLKQISQKVEALGEITASEPDYLERLAPNLWSKYIDALLPFGTGLAKGSSDPSLTFDRLVRLMLNQKLEIIQPTLFCGFVAGTHASNPYLAQKLQESVLDIPELKPHFVKILSATPITPWGTKKLTALATSGEFEAKTFEHIGWGRVHESIPDRDLSELLAALNNLPNGAHSTIEVLGMRFHEKTKTNYTPHECLRSVGRQAIVKMLSMHFNEVRNHQSYMASIVIAECLSEPIPEDEVRNIIDLLCTSISTYSRYGFSYTLHNGELDNLVNHLTKNFPEYVLDRTLTDKNPTINSIFREGGNDISPLNSAPIERVLKWCNGNQDKIEKVANAVSAYTTIGTDSQSHDNPQKVILSHHITSLLDTAQDKSAIVDIIFYKISPSHWIGSLAGILEVRSEAFSALLSHVSPDVRKRAQTHISHLHQKIEKRRVQEAQNYSQREQRFE